MSELIRDTATVFSREITPELRSPAGIVFAMGQPLLFLVLFGSMLAGTGADIGGADTGTGAGTGGDTWQWFVPGILVMMCLLGPLSAGHGMLSELDGGQMERFLVTPIRRTALVLGRTAKETVTLFAQAILLTAVAIPLGMPLHLPGALATLALLTVMAVGLSALSYVLAIASRPSGNLFWVGTQMLIFPVMLLSGILLPVDAGPDWLHAVAAVNPVTCIVDAARTLFTGDFLNTPVLYGLLSATAIATVGLVMSTRAMKHGI
ncbi:ABC transporter permease [Streptomyces sp. NPDC088116]|uniref:ABC transporter permease n=1 Tax=Streptomyces sp. NPDC088116 TaxID=3365825 RepID=UPI00382EF369